MTHHDILCAAWTHWLDLIRKKKRGEYVRERSLKDAEEALSDAVEFVILERHKRTP